MALSNAARLKALQATLAKADKAASELARLIGEQESEPTAKKAAKKAGKKAAKKAGKKTSKRR